MKPMGGSEILFHNLLKYMETDWSQKINLILSSCRYEFLSNSHKNVIWQHLNTNEENVALMSDPEFVNRVNYFVFVSHWQFNRFKADFQTPAFKSLVIKNAIEPIEYRPRELKEKTKLIYTSTPWRGLDVLLDSFALLNRDDVELDIFSSTKIYGENFENITKGQFDELFYRARNTKNVNFHEYAPNNVVREYLQQANIFAYPNTFEETSCLSAIEAAAAGCKIITTNHGALPETLGDFADFIPLGFNRDILVNSFASQLNQAIEDYWKPIVQYNLQYQANHFNRYYSWDYRKQEWQRFFQLII